MNDLRRPSLAEFIERAKDFDVRRGDLLVEGFAPQSTTILFRPTRDGTRHVVIGDVPLTDPLPTETIVRLCRALDLKPHDFGVFIG